MAIGTDILIIKYNSTLNHLNFPIIYFLDFSFLAYYGTTSMNEQISTKTYNNFMSHHH
jgi:hypothetical protein